METGLACCPSFGNKHLLSSFPPPGLKITSPPSPPQCWVINCVKSAAFTSGSFFNHETEFLCLKHSCHGPTRPAVWAGTAGPAAADRGWTASGSSRAHGASERAGEPLQGSPEVNENQMHVRRLQCSACSLHP